MCLHWPDGRSHGWRVHVANPLEWLGGYDRINTQELTQEEIRSIGLEVFAREFSPTGLIRFLQIYERGNGDYTQERADILPPLTAAQIAEKIREDRIK